MHPGRAQCPPRPFRVFVLQVCEFLDTATVCPVAGERHRMVRDWLGWLDQLGQLPVYGFGTFC